MHPALGLYIVLRLLLDFIRLFIGKWSCIRIYPIYGHQFVKMYVCVRIYVHVYIHIYILYYVHLYIHIYIYLNTYTHIYTSIYIFIHTYIYTYLWFLYTYLYIYLNTYTHIYPSIYIYPHTYIYIYLFVFLRWYICAYSECGFRYTTPVYLISFYRLLFVFLSKLCTLHVVVYVCPFYDRGVRWTTVERFTLSTWRPFNPANHVCYKGATNPTVYLRLARGIACIYLLCLLPCSV